MSSSIKAASLPSPSQRTMSVPGLLFVLGECGTEASVEEFNDWYDNEHGPARLTVPGLVNAVRYKAMDTETPSWLAIYDLSTSSVMRSASYKALAIQASEREKGLIPRLATLNRGIYDQLSEKWASSASPQSTPATFVFVVRAEVPTALETDFNSWYEEEHIPDIMKLGCLRARRYKLVESVELAGNANQSTGEPAYNFLTLYDWSTADYLQNPELPATLQTTNAIKIFNSLKKSMRPFVLHKNIQ